MKSTIDGVQIIALFTRNLKRLRNNAGLSQMKLAEKSGLSTNFISDIENGKRFISPESLAKLSKALKAEPYQFFLSDSKWKNQATEMISLYLDDFEDSNARMVAEFRSRFVPESQSKKTKTNKKD